MSIKGKVRLRLRPALVLGVAGATIVSLSACVPFGQGNEKTYIAARSIADELDLPSLGKTVYTSQWGTGINSSGPSIEFFIVSDPAATTLDGRLEDAGFVNADIDGVFVTWTRDEGAGTQFVSTRDLGPGQEASRHLSPLGKTGPYSVDEASVQIIIMSYNE